MSDSVPHNLEVSQTGALSLSESQKTMLSLLGRAVADAPKGLTRMNFFVPGDAIPAVCHFGKVEQEILIDANIWDQYTLATGEALEEYGSAVVVVQTFTDINPKKGYTESDFETSAQTVRGIEVTPGDKGKNLNRKRLLNYVPYSPKNKFI